MPPSKLWYLDGAQAFSSLDIYLLGLVIQPVIFVWDYLSVHMLSVKVMSLKYSG